MTRVSPDDLASIDGRIIPASEATIPITDDGLVRGDGVFEVIRVYDGKPYAMREHLDRIERSAANLRMTWDPPREDLERDVAELLEARDGGGAFDGVLRIMLTAGGRRILVTEPLPDMPERDPARLRHLRAAAHPRRRQVALLRARTCSPRGSPASAGSTRPCS